MSRGGWTNSTRRARLPRDWPQRRAAVLKRDHGVCWICHQPGADAVDHKQRGDNHSLANLAPIHQDVAPFCHRTKTAREANEVLAQRRAKRTRKPEPHPGQVDHA